MYQYNNIKTIIGSLSTYIPGLYPFLAKSIGGSTNSARYCYAVWMRHLILAYQNKLRSSIPEVVAELGPGYSIGTGIAALLSGTNKYYSLDVHFTNNMQLNLDMFDELITLFNNREDVPNEVEFPGCLPSLSNYKFPNEILTEEILCRSLNDNRINYIIEAIKNSRNTINSEITIKSFVPWFDSNIIINNSVDMIFSQNVLEHVIELNTTYNAFWSWLKPGGFISQKIDFDAHVLFSDWNDHWRYSDFVWNKFLWGKRPYQLNREPHSTHINLIKSNNFFIIDDLKYRQESKLKKDKMDKKFYYLNEDDLTIKSAFIQAKKL